MTGCVNISVAGKMLKRKVSSYPELEAAVDKIVGGTKRWEMYYCDEDKHQISMENEDDWEVFSDQWVNCTPTVHVRESTATNKSVLYIESTIAQNLRDLQHQYRMTSTQLLRYLISSRESDCRSSNFLNVSESLLIHTFLFLPASEICRLGSICQKWRGLVKRGILQHYIRTQGLYVIGGINHTLESKGVTLRTVLKCNPQRWPQQPSWSSASSMNDERYHCGTAVFRREVFVFGGRNGNKRLDSSESYDPITNTWKRLPPMKTIRSAPACAVHKGFIYVFGGFNGTIEYQTVERYDPVNQQWADTSSITAMPFEACELGAISLGNLIYVIGGTQRRHSPGEKVLSIVQSFNPDTNEWCVLPSMSTKRMCPAAVSYRGKLWVIGGSDGDGALNSVECFDPVTQVWSEGPPMVTLRSNATATVTQGRIYVTGGFYVNEGGPLNTVECYDPSSGWIMMNWNMPEKRDACKVLTWE
eukprot:TRINITY_DN3782_c7_g1_i1.p1 TRINITY_DN3782_c7_g1~~TRINITY_DN3782_c7_g1_i1.p1  ORF type:complete len:473 (+),score=53.51 TRINITY_DN3782_c7_g1_i1:165-1583(+)